MFKKELISLDFDAKTRDQVIEHLAKLFAENQCLSNASDAKKEFIKAIHEREKTGSTALGLGFAIPHGRSSAVTDAAVGFVRLSSPIQWDDDEQVGYIFLLGVPTSTESNNNHHLQILAKLSGAIMEDSFREELEQASSSSEVLAILNQYTTT